MNKDQWYAKGCEKKVANESLWEQIGNECLHNALILLKKEAVPTAGTVETAKGLVEMAFLIDYLNLRWAQQTQFGAGAFQGRF